MKDEEKETGQAARGWRGIAMILIMVKKGKEDKGYASQNTARRVRRCGNRKSRHGQL